MTETFSLYILGRKYTEDIPPKHSGYDLLLPAMQGLKKKKHVSRILEQGTLKPQYPQYSVLFQHTGGFLSAGCVCVCISNADKPQEMKL